MVLFYGLQRILTFERNIVPILLCFMLFMSVSFCLLLSQPLLIYFFLWNYDLFRPLYNWQIKGGAHITPERNIVPILLCFMLCNNCINKCSMSLQNSNCILFFEVWSCILLVGVCFKYWELGSGKICCNIAIYPIGSSKYIWNWELGLDSWSCPFFCTPTFLCVTLHKLSNYLNLKFCHT